MSGEKIRVRFTGGEGEEKRVSVTVGPPFADVAVNDYFAANSALLAVLKGLGIDAGIAIIADLRESAWATDASTFKGKLDVLVSKGKRETGGTITDEKNVRSADGLTFVLTETRGTAVVYVLSDATREEYAGWYDRRRK